MLSIGLRKIFSMLLLVLSALVLLFLLANIYFSRATTRHYQNLYLDQQHLQLQLSAAAIQEKLLSSLAETKVLASYSFVEYEQGLRSEQSILDLLKIEQTVYNSVVLYAYFENPEGPTFLQAVEGEKGNTAEKAARESARRQWENFRIRYGEEGEITPYVLPLYADQNAQLASFAYPVVVDQEFKGILYITMDIGFFAKRYLEPFSSIESCAFFITDAQGRIIWCPNLQNVNQPAEEAFPFFPTTGQFPEGNSIETTPQGRYFIAWSSVDFADTEIHLVMATPAESIISVPLQVRIWRIAINLLLTLSAVLSLLYTLRLYRAHKRHQEQIKKQQQLQQEVAEKNRQLQKAANRYSLLFENANDGIFIVKGMRIIQCNTRAAQLFNFSKEELIGKSPMDLSPENQPDGSSSEDKAKYYSKRCLSGIPQIYEWRHVDSHGTEFTAEVSLSAINIGQEILFQSFIRDVTARKEMEQRLQHVIEEREVMLQEIHHRVKNNLQIIDSILSLQRNHTVEDDRATIIPQVRRRIAAMAEAHETMYRQQDFNTVNMGEFLLHLVLQLEGSFVGTNKKLQPAVQPIGLPLEKGLLVGFVTSELVENAFLHACPRNGQGLTIKVSLTQDPEDPQNAVLEVADDGELPEGEEALHNPGLGMELISAMTQQLQGAVNWRTDIPGSGVHVILHFPKESD
ncbi:MAG: histidine kinase dimerization/phosphoacceptor domain -containing protein [Spirochaetia bacterium]